MNNVINLQSKLIQKGKKRLVCVGGYEQIPEGAITFEGETEPLTFENETEVLTFENAA